jgi:hypothetical protein
MPETKIYPVRNVQGTNREIPIFWVYPKTETTPVWLAKVDQQLLDMSISYSIDGATALTFTLIDPGFELTRQNYFQTGQTIIYRSHNSQVLLPNSSGSPYLGLSEYIGYFMEIADVNIEQSQGNSPTVRIQCYTKAVQQMKRDRQPGNIKGNGSDFVKNAAKKYGLNSVVQKTSASRQITTADSDNAADSLWTVLDKLANESKDENKNPFVMFESDGTLYFGSQQWIMYKWGHTSYPHTKYDKTKKKDVVETRYVTNLNYPSGNDPFLLLKMPTMHKSENDPKEGNGSCIVDRINGTRLRPGMTVRVRGVPWFDDDFLITEVNFSELVPDPVNISFATPPRSEKKIKQIEVGQIYPGSVEWATVVGITQQQPAFNSPEKAVAKMNPNTASGGANFAI